MKVRKKDSSFTHLRIENKFFITYKKKLFYPIIIVSTLILLLPFCSEKTENISETKVRNIYDLLAIPQDENYILSNPKKMIYFGDKIYILDMKLRRILAYAEGGYSHSIGSPGQGPGEMSHPISFDIEADELYLLNIPNRIEVFDLQGNYKKTIKLKLTIDSIPAFWDLKIYDEKIYISIDIGNIKVKRYGLDGNHNDDFICAENTFAQGKYALSNPYNIYILPDINRLILFNQFNGDIEIHDLATGTMLTTIRDYDNFIVKKSREITKEIKRSFSNKEELEIKTFIFLKSTIDAKQKKLWIIPSQTSLKDEGKRSIIFGLNILGKDIEKNILEFDGSDKTFLNHFCISNTKIFFIDEELNIYKGEIE